ncbi:MAG: hypothetical protein ACKV2T_36350 [Kofleriaceae bacterium]
MMKPWLLVRFLVLWVLVACSDDGGVRKLDDAPPFDVAPGSVTVTLQIGGVPVPNRTVIFQGPDGVELATVQTDANGTASAVVPAGSSVTTLDLLEVRFNRPGRNVVTVMGVQPGDDLRLRGDADLVSTDVTFTYPTFTGGGPTPLYGVVTNCNNNEAGTNPTTSTLPVPRCAGRFDVVMFVIDGLGGALHYIAKADQPFGNIDVSGETWTAVTTLGSTYTNVPPAAVSLSSGRRITSPRGPLYTCIDTLSGSGSTRTAQISCPSFPWANQLDVLAYYQGQTAYSILHAITTDAPALDVANTHLTAPSRDLTLDIPTRRLAWQESSGDLAPDFVGVHIETQDLDWHVIAPYASNTLVLPPLLGDAANHDLEPTDNAYPVVTVGAAAGGYDAVRRFGPNYLDQITTEIPWLITAEFSEGS